MDLFRRQDLNELLAQECESCLSIYLPTHRTGRDMEQDPIRLKNLLRDAENQLIAGGLRGPDARAFLEEGTRLLTEGEFWRHLSDGLALFFAPGFHRRYRLPIAVDEAVHRGRQFYVRPLLPLLHGDGRFFLLALSQKKVRLYHANRAGMEEIELEGVPENVMEAVQAEDLQQNLQHRSWGPRASNVRRAKRSLGTNPASGVVFHGQGSDEDMHKKNVAEFFQQIDKGVTRKLQAERAPLLLACVEYEAPIYREHNHYPHLVDEVVLGNPEQWEARELHHRAWEAVRPHFYRTLEVELSKFRKLPADRISTDLQRIGEAAHQGRVESLFVRHENNGANGARRSGTQPREDALARVAADVLRSGGEVFALAPEVMPERAIDAAAIFRYALP